MIALAPIPAMLYLAPQHIEAMTAHAEATYPEECCGLLLGTRGEQPDDYVVRELKPLINAWNERVNPFAATDVGRNVDKRSRFWVDPQVLMQTQKAARDRGWIVLGVYHSHPDHPAVPSSRDQQMAWAEYAYPILSVTAGKVTAIASWRLGANGEFCPEAIAPTAPQNQEV